ncbi:MAG: hypothetical protein ACI8RD_013359 [Bacillariaceae sp.]|jgi:hypothetical protein
MRSVTTLFIAWLSVIGSPVCAFQDASISTRISNHHRAKRSVCSFLYDPKSIDHQCENSQARRSFLSEVALCGVALTTLTTQPKIAEASGGATAGGAYLLSAKRRYYDRVKASVSSLMKVADGLKSGDSSIAKDFFSSEDGGSWTDLKAAGYLLSNAFRRSASTNPDSLPAVKVRNM